MAIAIRASANATTITNTLTITKPTGTASGDVLIAGIYWYKNPTVTPPAGWTLIKTTPNGSNCALSTYYKVAGGAEPADYAWTVSVLSTYSAIGFIAAYSGADSTPLDVYGESTGYSKNITVSSLTTTAANDKLLFVGGILDDVTSISPLFYTGLIEQVEIGKSTYVNLETFLYDKTIIAVGETGISWVVYTNPYVKNWCAQSILIKEAAQPITIATGIASAESIGTATLDQPQMIFPTSISTLEALGDPAVRLEGIGKPELIQEIILTENNLFLIAEVMPNAIDGLEEDIVDWPDWLVKYLSYGVLERAFGAESDGYIPSLRDYWKQRKDIGIQAILKFKRMRLADRTFVMGGGRAKGRGRGPCLPDGYPRVD